jgi:hypothetical protein
MVIDIIGIFVLALGVIVWALTPSTVTAQCGENPPPKSSCITCHEKEDPVYQNGEWHGIHALKDCCTNCHGGNCSTMDKELAHEGLVAHPLEDIYTNCYYCHPSDYQARAERFAVILGVTPSSSPTATPFPVGPVAENPIVILPSLTSASFSLPFWIPVLGGFTFLFILILVLGIVFYRLRNQRHSPV